MVLDDIGRALDLIGLSISVLFFAILGGALGIAYSPPMTRGQVLAALGSAILFGGLGPEVVGSFWTLPPVLENACAALFGIGGMFIVPGLIVAWREFSSNPWGFIDRLRGVAKPPGKDNTPGGQP